LDIVETNRKRIPRLYPRWTDFNYHDPGITFMELFAWLKEVQQYHLDQIGVRNYIKYLKLFGMELKHRQPARTLVMIRGQNRDFMLERGVPLSAGGIVFETARGEQMCKAVIEDICSISGEQRISVRGQLGSDAGKLSFPVFGREPAVGDSVNIAFSDALPAGKTLRFYVEVADDHRIPRNPIGEADFYPLAELKWEYLSVAGWRELTVTRDETWQFIESGRIEFILPEAMAPSPEDGWCWIRAVLSRAEYEVAPVLHSLFLNMAEVSQQETRSLYEDFALDTAGGVQEIVAESYLAKHGLVKIFADIDDGWQEIEEFTAVSRDKEGITAFRFTLPQGTGKVRLVCYQPEFSLKRLAGEAYGFPWQEFDLEATDILYDSLAIMVEEADRPGFYTDWYKVIDFDASGPEDRHYTFYEDSGLICFGDAEHGMAPEGIINLIGFATSLGRAGNIKEGKINRLVNADISAEVINLSPAAGGKDPETLNEGFRRFRQDIREVERAITYRDYEDLVRRTPGLMINNCKAIPVSLIPRRDGSLDENAVSVVVQPYTNAMVQKLNPAYEENIYRQLGGRHLIGTRINVLSPEYVGIDIFVEIAVKPYYRDARERIEEVVNGFFASGVGDFGGTIYYSTIYGLLDTLDCVEEIRSLAIDAQGKGITRTLNGDVMLPQNGIAYMKAAEYVISTAE
ncbi:MAG: baseplate J/gp47 family protein, partial [Syntrophomonadaceae bacterium]|nr:baseplate J/gp47 family protein [Syntrophomonadaceae bacterium]